MFNELGPDQSDPGNNHDRQRLERVAHERQLILDSLSERILDLNQRLTFTNLEKNRITDITPDAGKNCTLMTVHFSNQRPNDPPSCKLTLCTDLEVFRDQGSMAFQDVFHDSSVEKILSPKPREAFQGRLNTVRRLRHSFFRDRHGQPYRSKPHEQTRRFKFRSHTARQDLRIEDELIRAACAEVIPCPSVEFKDFSSQKLHVVDFPSGQVIVCQKVGDRVERHDFQVVSPETLAAICEALDTIESWIGKEILDSPS